MSPAPQKFYRLDQCTDWNVRSGDLLLYRRRGLVAIAGRSEYSHAAKAVWWGGDLFVLEVREWYGGRLVLAKREVARRPGMIDVFETNPLIHLKPTVGRAGFLDEVRRFPEYKPIESLRIMRRFAGTPYGWTNVALAGCLHLPFLRCFMKPETDDQAGSRRPPFCSQAIAIAERIGGKVDPVPNLADRLTEPADLARSQLYRYRFTLIP